MCRLIQDTALINPRTINVQKLKSDFRAACAQHGIDPATGSVGTQATAAAYRLTSFGKALAAAEERKATHFPRMRQLVYSRQYTKLRIPKPDNPDYWVYLFGDDHGGINWDKVELHASRGWWEQSSLWVPGLSRFITDFPIDVKMNGDPEPHPEVGGICNLRWIAEQIEKRRKARVLARVERLMQIDEVVEMMLHEVFMEMRGQLPLKRLHEKQAVAEDARRAALKFRPNVKLTKVNTSTIPVLYN